MSLDVWLTIKGEKKPESNKAEQIFIREDGTNKEISREEWDRRFPGQEPVVFTPQDDPDDDSVTLFDGNITHNLGKMAAEAGLYDCMWQPKEHGITKASELIEPLTAGLFVLKNDRPKFEAFNPNNGWGDYDGLVRFVENYLVACTKYPDAYVSAWR